MNRLLLFPVAGRDYPRTWSHFLDWFSDEDACGQYLQRLRWPQGFVCPRCGEAAEPYRATRTRLMCRGCRHQCTVTAGTVFEKTRTPLRSWFAAVWYATNQKHGISALGLQRVLGLSSYQTAWAMLHRLRRAMVRPGRERLGGRVEVDEAYVGGPTRGSNGRERDGQVRHWHNTAKAIVAIAVEVHNPKGFGRVRLRRVSAATGARLIPFVCEAVEPGSEVHTDGSPVYWSLSEHGYIHHRSVVSSSDPRRTCRCRPSIESHRF